MQSYLFKILQRETQGHAVVKSAQTLNPAETQRPDVNKSAQTLKTAEAVGKCPKIVPPTKVTWAQVVRNKPPVEKPAESMIWQEKTLAKFAEADSTHGI